MLARHSIDREREREIAHLFNEDIYIFSSFKARRVSVVALSAARSEMRCQTRAQRRNTTKKSDDDDDDATRSSSGALVASLTNECARTHATTRVLPFARAKTYSGGRSDESARRTDHMCVVFRFKRESVFLPAQKRPPRALRAF